MTYQKRVENIVRRYRNRLGINPSYHINVSIDDEDEWPKAISESVAWLEELATHPVFTIHMRKSNLSRDLLTDPRIIIRNVVHELLHIVVGEGLKGIKRNYSYTKEGKIEEKLVMQLARAIVPMKKEEQ